MKTWAALILMVSAGALYGQEPAAFEPPQAYPMDRYEASWAKNPFTLKTAPAVVDNVSFAKDLAIGGHYGDKANPTIVIVNTKTHERTNLKKGETASSGMKLSDVKLGETRKLTTVEVTMGTETSELTYSSEYLSQVASSDGGKAAQSPQQMLLQQQQQQGRPMPGAVIPGGVPGRVTPGIPPKIQLPAGNPVARPGTAGVQPGARNVANGGMVNNGAGFSNNANNINLTVPGDLTQPAPNQPLISSSGSPLPPRRRMIPSSTNGAVPQ